MTEIITSKGNSIQIVLGGKDKDHNISYSAFMGALNSLHELIEKVQKKGGYNINLEIKELSHSSPVRAEITCSGEDTNLFLGELNEGFQHIQNIIQKKPEVSAQPRPEFVDAAYYIAKDIYKNEISDFQLTLQENGVQTQKILLSKNHYSTCKEYKENNREENPKDHIKISGRLIELNIHEGYKMAIYTVLGDKIICIFDEELLPKMIELIGKHVRIFGLAEYKGGRGIPYKMHVQDIEWHKDPEKRVSLKDLRGIAPGITKGKGAVAFVREMRDAKEK